MEHSGLNALRRPKDEDCMAQNMEDGITNSMDSDQPECVVAIWSGSALLAQIYLSQYLFFIVYHLQP